LHYESARHPLLLGESGPVRLGEIEIQARLFNGEYGTRWKTTDGRPFEILHFGEWNREAGPDFKGAVIRFDGEEEKSGDIEVDWEPRDWERHGHAVNPAYAGVMLHFFIEGGREQAFARTLDHREVPQARLVIEMPGGIPLRPPREAVDMGAAKAMVCEAAEFRLRSKQAAQARAVALHGGGPALFHALATGLGYKNNTIPFLLTAQRVRLRNAGGSAGEALLFGLAGFLEPRSFDEADAITRRYLKPLWDHWWSVRDFYSRIVLERKMWKLSGIRPANHPHRRMGALAALASGFDGLLQAFRSGGVKSARTFLEKLEHPYWGRHWNLSAAVLEKPVALIGSERVTDLLVNALIPSLPLDAARSEWQRLRGPQPSGRLLRASVWLVGSEQPALFRTAWQQQGLLQLYTDFGAMPVTEAWSRIRPPGPLPVGEV
jgi:hypothetical protein